MPDAEETEVWGDGTIPLHISAYLTADDPPSTHVTSVRGLIVGHESVLVIWDHNNSPQLLPGGRREPEETLHETLHREALEEAGVEVVDPVMLGFLWYHHLAAKPADYVYPYPDFLQTVFCSRAGAEHQDAKVHDEFVTRSGFYSLSDVQSLRLRARDRLFLTAALTRLADRAL